MKKILILMLIICPHLMWGQSYLETFYQEEERQKQEKAAEHRAFLTETVNMLLGDTDGEEVIGGFSFVKSNYGYYVLTDCPREKYRKFSHNFFRETNSKPLYGKYSKPRNGEDWFVTLKDGDKWYDYIVFLIPTDAKYADGSFIWDEALFYRMETYFNTYADLLRGETDIIGEMTTVILNHIQEKMYIAPTGGTTETHKTVVVE